VWTNLRLASGSQNGGNQTVRKNNKLCLKGVRLHQCGKFTAEIKCNGKKKYLGLHVTKELAAAAYATAADKCFGVFARHGEAANDNVPRSQNRAA
jgi:hypothetical protein